MINKKYNKEINQSVFKGINQNKVTEITMLKLSKICVVPGTFISLCRFKIFMLVGTLNAYQITWHMLSIFSFY